MGEPVIIRSRKYDGRISKSWQAELIEKSRDVLLFKGVFDFDVNHEKLGFIRRGTISYEYYWPEKWYNVFRFHQPEGELRGFYCNVAMPPRFGDEEMDYIDLDLDILANPDLSYELLDMDEFEEHTTEFGYPAEVVEKAMSGLSELIGLIENRQFPFNHKI